VTALELLLLGLVGLVAGTVNTIAGGGSFITLAAMLWMGLPPVVANATNRVGVVVQSGAATVQFHREGQLRTGGLVAGGVAACAGALIGAWVSLELDEELFERLIGVIMLAFVPVLLLRPKRWLQGAEKAARPWLLVPALFALGVYGGLLQAGVGIFLLAALVLLGGHDLVRANARKAFVVMLFTIPALLLFVWQDQVLWLAAIALSLGSAVGGWLGTKLTVKWGPGFVRAVLILVIAVSAVRLLL
jgi:hypothetical protein